jgi:hypothetical protein
MRTFWGQRYCEESTRLLAHANFVVEVNRKLLAPYHQEHSPRKANVERGEQCPTGNCEMSGGSAKTSRPPAIRLTVQANVNLVARRGATLPLCKFVYCPLA